MHTPISSSLGGGRAPHPVHAGGAAIAGQHIVIAQVSQRHRVNPVRPGVLSSGDARYDPTIGADDVTPTTTEHRVYSAATEETPVAVTHGSRVR